MNLRCIYCQTPFTLNRAEMLSGIVMMNAKNQSHYDAHCPRCRRANSISRQRMELFYPNWQEDAEKQKAAAAAAAAPKAEAPAEPAPKAKAAKKPSEKKTTADKKPAEKKPAAAKKTPAKQPATKKK